MTTLTVASGSATAAFPVSPGTYAVGWRVGTATAGTLTFATTWKELAGDPGRAVRDPDGTAYSWDLSTTTSGGFQVLIEAEGHIVPTIASGTNGQTLHLTVSPIAPR